MSAYDTLRPHVGANRLGTVILDETAEDARYGGFVVGLSATFVVLQNVEDWREDGMTIFPLDRVHGFEFDATDEERTVIANWRRIVPRNLDPWLDLSDWPALFTSLKGRVNVVGVCDGNDAEVGEIVDIAAARITQLPRRVPLAAPIDHRDRKAAIA